MGLKEILQQCPIRKYQNPLTAHNAIQAYDAIELNKQELTKRLIKQYEYDRAQEDAKKRGEKPIGQG